MSDFRRGALNDACVALAKSVYPGSMELSPDVIETLAYKYETIAIQYLDYIVMQGRDPNILTRAVTYLCDAHGIPPMGTEMSWFENMFQCVIELAVPNSLYGGDALNFLNDVRDGIVEVIEASDSD